MRTRIILELATLLAFLLGNSIEGLFFQYPKNVLTDFFQSLHTKKEMKKPPQIHHYHLHYYPVHTEIVSKPVRAPDKFGLDKLHSNHLESLGWSENEYKHVPEPDIYRPGLLMDNWPESTRPWSWEDVPENSNHQSVEQPMVSKPGLILHMPFHQNIIVQQPTPKKEKQESHPLVNFFQKIKKIKNSLFSHQDDTSDTDYWEDKYINNDKTNGYVVYLPPENGRKL